MSSPVIYDRAHAPAAPQGTYGKAGLKLHLFGPIHKDEACEARAHSWIA